MNAFMKKSKRRENGNPTRVGVYSLPKNSLFSIFEKTIYRPDVRNRHDSRV